MAGCRGDADRQPRPSAPGGPGDQASAPAPAHVVKLKHRPALYGLRGFAVSACLIYQTFTSVLTGAWIGVDVFLVLSGFFIASMLLRERRRFGSIDYLQFLARRARRLLPRVAAVEKPYVVYFLPINLLADYRVDGQIVAPGSPAHDTLVRATLEEVLAIARQNGATGFGLNNLACHQRDDFGTDPTIARSNDMSAVKHLNSVAVEWASSRGVAVFNTYAALCPGDKVHERVEGVELYGDQLHFTSAAAAVYWQWLAPQIQAAAERG